MEKKDNKLNIKALPKPAIDSNPFLALLHKRHSTREFSPRPLTDQALADLLWAAFGVSRPETGMRTAPSAVNMQEIEVYAATADGLYRYLPDSNELELADGKDLRAATGFQEFCAVAPVDLIYVADLNKYADDRFHGRGERFSWANAGHIAENVYLYCASTGLVTVIRAAFDAEALGKTLNLRPGHKAIMAQTVGYPTGKSA